MTRQNVLYILGAAAAVIVLGLTLVWATQKTPAPEPSPSAPVTVSPGSTLPPAPTPSTGSPTPTATESHEGHNHEGEFPSCEDDRLCDPTKESVDNVADLPAALAVQPQVRSFVTAWLTLPAGESAEDRAARIAAAGGAAVSEQETRIARGDSSTAGITAEAKPLSTMMVLFLQREDGLLKFRADVNVDAYYTRANGALEQHTMNGLVTVWVDDAGNVQKVSEDFRVLDELP